MKAGAHLPPRWGPKLSEGGGPEDGGRADLEWAAGALPRCQAPPELKAGAHLPPRWGPDLSEDGGRADLEWAAGALPRCQDPQGNSGWSGACGLFQTHISALQPYFPRNPKTLVSRKLPAESRKQLPPIASWHRLWSELRRYLIVFEPLTFVLD